MKKDQKKSSRTKSSKAWLDRQHKDIYTQRAKQEGFRSRAVYKLVEIQEKDRLCKPGMTVIDLGAAPGGWSQVVARWVGGSGRIIAVDLLPIDPILGVDSIIEGDFREAEVVELLEAKLGQSKVDLILSDMAPNFSGVTAVDQARTVYLGEWVLDFAKRVLRPGGNLLIKQFQGAGFEAYVADLKAAFQSVSVRKPKASHKESKEVYLLAKHYSDSPQVRG